MKKKKVYLSGSITNNPDYEKQFNEAKESLQLENDWIVFSPVKIDGFEYKEYIDMGLNELMHCNAICMLPGWETSKGAILEKVYAETVGIDVINYKTERTRQSCLVVGVENV